MATVKQLLTDGETALAGSDSGRLDAEVLLACSLNRNRTWLYTWPEHIPTLHEQHLYLELLRRRQDGQPVAYLTGRREFWGLLLKITHDVLIPRPETELLIETLLERMVDRNDAIIADLGTGSGAIALALASEKPDWKFVATDASDKALAVAKENAERLELCNIDFRQGVSGEWTTPLAGMLFDAIVSNPPYVEEKDIHLEQGDVLFEPIEALVSGPQGLDDIKKITSQTGPFLHPGGWLMVEHGYNQGEAVRSIFTDSGFTEVETLRDLAGQERVTVGRRR